MEVCPENSYTDFKASQGGGGGKVVAPPPPHRSQSLRCRKSLTGKCGELLTNFSVGPLISSSRQKSTMSGIGIVVVFVDDGN